MILRETASDSCGVISRIGLMDSTKFQTVRNDRKMHVLIYLREKLISVSSADKEKTVFSAENFSRLPL